jgi:hypothetical protein
MSRTRDALADIDVNGGSVTACARRHGIAQPTLAKALKARRAKWCLWHLAEPGLWESGCSGRQCRVTGTLADAGLVWCPSCGKRIEEK